VYFLNLKLGLNAVLAFWIAYILTRPLGASIGDYLSQPRADGGLGLGTTVTSVIFLLTILAVVIYLTITKVDRIERDPGETRTRVSRTGSLVLLVTNKVRANAALVAAVQERVTAGPATFFLLVPNPHHGSFDRISDDLHEGEALLAEALTALEEVAGGPIGSRVASSPNAYDDIVAELASGDYSEVILETPPSHVSHWLHIDLPQRIAALGYPLVTVAVPD